MTIPGKRKTAGLPRMNKHRSDMILQSGTGFHDCRYSYAEKGLAMRITEKLKDKRILIWGYGREGKSTERFIREFCRVKSLEIFEGKQSEIREDAYDYIIKSPGIRPDHMNEKYTSQTQLFLEEFRDRTVGVTGTKGKSTTSSLLYTVLSACSGKKTFLVGNIGYPCLDYYGEIDQESIVVFEMSCHQLSTVTVSPHTAVFLNLYEEHLDYYGTFEKYFEAKKHITLYQTEEDEYYCGDTVPAFPTRARKHTISYEDPRTYSLQILGSHNQYNARFVYDICTEVFGCGPEAVREAMASFRSLPHRLEFVGRFGGIDYYNDSISTIPEASIQAIRSVPNTGSVIIGGMDRHIHYDILIDFIKEHPEYKYILCYETGERICRSLSGLDSCFQCRDLYEAVELAARITPEGKACLLSPAAASYGYFKNFEDRGDTFKALVKGESLSFAFTGDIGFDKYMDRKWEDPDLIAPEVLAFLHSADHVAANIEGPLSRADMQLLPGSNPSLMHSMDPAITGVLRRMKADIWNLNNNHIMDAGQKGLEDTLRCAEDFGAMTVGAGMNLEEASRPLYFDRAGGIGIFAVGYRRGCKPAGEDHGGCLLWNEMDLIREKILEIKKKCRWCLMICHGGEEFTSLPSPYVRDRYLEYLDMGADIVVCHHPHVPMNYELTDRGAIFYSLGNFIFDTDYQRAQFNTEKGILLKLVFTESHYFFKAAGIRIQRGEEHVVPGDLPDIFENVPGEEYEKLAPLAAEMFISATKRQQRYLKPAEFADMDEEKWKEHFFNPTRSGRVPGEALDFTLVYPLAQKAKEEAWKQSRLTKVTEYIREQI